MRMEHKNIGMNKKNLKLYFNEFFFFYIAIIFLKIQFLWIILSKEVKRNMIP